MIFVVIVTTVSRSIVRGTDFRLSKLWLSDFLQTAACILVVGVSASQSANLRISVKDHNFCCAVYRVQQT